MSPVPPASLLAPETIARLADLARDSEPTDGWPGRQWDLLREAGVLRWTVPAEFGGLAVDTSTLMQGYLALARSCLTTAFVLTQRNGACQRIAQSPNSQLRQSLLPQLARGEIFATVGISHLTTSRQHHGTPAVECRQSAEGFTLTGEIPWVTGAAHAQFIVTGGTLSDGRQVLVAVPTATRGVSVAPPVQLLALTGSSTSPVLLDHVLLDARWIVQPPVHNVMQQGAGVSTGSLSTSALAAGVSLAAIEALEVEAGRRPLLEPVAQSLRYELEQLQNDLLTLSESEVCGVPTGANESVRTRANSLVLRSTQALMAAAKGAGFVRGHFAERAAREALFFLVWSCPQPVVSANLREFAGLSGEAT